MAEDKRPYWRLVAKSKRHAYYQPADNRPGIALFVLVGTLGLVALGFALAHWRRLGVLGHDDKMLAMIGTALLALGLWQGLKLTGKYLGGENSPEWPTAEELTSADMSAQPPENAVRELPERIRRQRPK